MNACATTLFAVLPVLLGARTTLSQTVELRSPKKFQVFQRRTAPADGTLVIEGRTTGFNGRLQFRLTGKSVIGDLPGNWKPIPPMSDVGHFQATAQVPAGGWYRLEVRSQNENPPRILATTEHVGIGEVFIVAGQSNSTNYGSERQKVQSGFVVSFDGESWRIADDPQPGVQDRSQKGSFIPPFGDAMYARYKVPIAIASAGCGSTSVRQWLPKGRAIDIHPTTNSFIRELAPGQWESSGQLYDGLLKRIRSLGPNGFRALLWHQGESDAGQARAGFADRQITADQYRQLMEELIRDAHKDAGWDFPWFVAQATYHSPADPSDEDFRAAQRALADCGLALAGPDTDALTAPLRAGVHFNAKGLQAHGELWVKSVAPYLDRQPAAKP
jgi:hypothetical protein